MDSKDREYILRILNIECQSCYGRFPMKKLQMLTSCQCVMCQGCFKMFFEFAVREKHVTEIVCQFCDSLDQSDPEQMDMHSSTLDTQLRDCLDPEVFDIYSKKLMEYTIMKDPKFLWCCHCSFGFIYEGNQLKIQCTSCHKSFCSQCKKPWEPQHQDLSCEMFLQWKRDNDPEWQKQGLVCFLQENGITCPSCGFQYALAKGGCMHFTCLQCKHQFCSGCNQPFHKALCKNVPCTINGLHAHHPRDCLFYMRDWKPDRLKELLQLSGVAFNTDPPADTENLDACSVMQQKEEGVQLLDQTCGNKTEPGQAGLCEKHYREYLVSLINDNSLDPATLYDGGELAAACARYSVVVQRGEGEEDYPYKARLLEKLKEVPLGENVARRK
ncbi:E3 ubiquitin-protein ligase RNF31 isoform X3 [Gadus morhua]|nr:E3 ubiquitin-protein ligase RNF31-like isoform X3 [Gadus morhua]